MATPGHRTGRARLSEDSTFGELRREVEIEMVAGREPSKDVLAEIRSTWDAVERAAPGPPQTLYNKARQIAGSREPRIEWNVKMRPTSASATRGEATSRRKKSISSVNECASR